jgi:WD40 repeat protein
VASWQAHTGAVYDVALAADGQLLATSSLDGTVRLWQAPFGEPIAHAGDSAVVPLSGGWRLQATLQGHTSAVWSVALSTDGHLLVSGSTEGTIRLWDARSARPLATLQGHSGHIYGVALSADAQLLASGSWDGTIRLWDVTSGRPLAALQAHGGGVRSVALTADGQLLASGGRDGTVRLWQARTGQLLATLQGHTNAVWGVALSSDGRLLASGGLDGTVRLWDTSSGACVRILRSDRHYERLDITGLTGVTDAQRAALRALGAVEHNS